jgi:predicted transposase YdaD
LEQPVVFVEAQMQPDPGFYGRFFAEVYVYLKQYQVERQCRGLLILESRSQRLGSEKPYFEQLQAQVQRFYLEDLIEAENLSPTLKLMQLFVLNATAIGAAAQKLLASVAKEADYPKWLDVVEAILVSKFPEAGLEGVRKMLGIQTENLSHTQFYKDVLKIGEERGKQQGEAKIVLRQLTYRFGQIDANIEAQVRALTTEKLEALSQALLEFQNISEFQAWLGFNNSL